MTLCEHLTETGVRDPARVAFLYSDADLGAGVEATLTYDKLVKLSLSVAARIAGVGGGERAILLFPAGLDFIAAFYGCLYAGIIAIPIPIPKAIDSDNFRKIIKDSQPRFIISTERIRKKLDKEPTFQKQHPFIEWIAVDLGQYDPAEQNLTVRKWELDDIAYLQYTSGSTANPQGVVVTHGNVMANCSAIMKLWGMTDSSVAVSWLPHFHDMGLITGIILPIISGCTSVLLPPTTISSKPLLWLAAIDRYRGTHSAAPNFGFQACVDKVTAEESESLDLSCWKIAMCGAEPIRRSTVDRFVEKFTASRLSPNSFRPAYGLAEATLVLTEVAESECFRSKLLDASSLATGHAVDTPNQAGIVVVSCGAPLESTTLAIVDPDTLRVCPDGRIGEIWAHGPSITSGYWKDLAASQPVFHASTPDVPDKLFLRTGDLGFVDRGEIFVSGRLKDLIIIRGRNIYPNDIEALMQDSHDSVRSMGGAAFALQTDGLDELVVVQEVRRVKRHRLDGVIDAIRRRITSDIGATPSSIVLVNESSIPRTTSGKVRRRFCREQYVAGNLSVLESWSAQEIKTYEIKGSAPPSKRVSDAVMEMIAQRIGFAPTSVSPQKTFAEYGFDSHAAVEAATRLSSVLGYKLAPTLLYDHPTSAELIRHLSEFSPAETEPMVAADHGNPHQEPRSATLLAEEIKPARNHVAVIGIGCQFPGAEGPKQFWNLLEAGQCSISEYPQARVQSTGTPIPHRGGFLKSVDAFDARFFGISPAEATLMDPQQRLLMQVTVHALEDAGVTRKSLRGKRVGVFVGISNSDYGRDSLASEHVQDSYTVSGSALSIAANRLSYAFDWIGPSVSIDTACSSSLVAVHEAVKSLSGGECDLAIACGANLILSPAIYRDFQTSGLLSPEGLCKAFDKSADGYVRSEGFGAVVLRRLSETTLNHDRTYAFVLGSAINHNGRSNGLLAPKHEAQRVLLQSAWAKAEIEPADLAYIEAHGTGTALGDAIELQAIEAALAGVPNDDRCRVGSVKSNLGHTESAAGIAGFIKAALAIHHGKIPPTLHFHAINEHFRGTNQRLQIAHQGEPWPSSKKRIAAVSSFGFGGSNAHVVLAGNNTATRSGTSESPIEDRLSILPLSAVSRETLHDLAFKYDSLLREMAVEEFRQHCSDVALRRDHYTERLAIVARSAHEARGAIHDATSRAAANGTRASAHLTFVFSGQGSYDEGLGKELLDRQAHFRHAMDTCTQILETRGLPSAADILCAANCEAFDQQYDGQQLRLFLFQIGLFAILHACGVKPSAVVGHSLGELAAAYVTGVLTLEESVKLVLLRSKLCKAITGQGTLLAVRCAGSRCRLLIAEAKSSLEIALENGPNNVVVSGSQQEIDRFSSFLKSQKVPAQRVRINFAAHSSMLDPYREHFLEDIPPMTGRSAKLPLYSSTLGAAVGPSAFTAEYWWNNLRKPVLFSSAIQSALRDGCTSFLELSGYPLLLPSIKDIAANPNHVALYPMCDVGLGEELSLFRSIANLYSDGFDIDWRGIFDKTCDFRGFPLYPFEQERFWYKPVVATGVSCSAGVKSPHFAEPQGGLESPGTSLSEVTEEVREIVARILQQQVERIDPQAPFLDLGADSIVITKTLRAIEQRFKVPLSIQQLFEHQRTVSSLAAFVHRNMGEHAHTRSATQPSEPTHALSPSLRAPLDFALIEKIMLEQLAANSRLATEQLQVLRGLRLDSSAAADKVATVAIIQQANGNEAASRSLGTSAQQSSRAGSAKRFVPYQPFNINTARTSSGHELLGTSLQERIQRKTPTSKAITQNNRRILADNRASAGFRMSNKELLYPIHADRSQGAYIYDCDSNKYVDITMGFGTNLFGHNPDFIKQALTEQLERGFQLGPQIPLAGEVARLISQFTGMERVTFCNSGTEAVMTALRLARTAIGRRKIVIFDESYHGTFDGILADHQDGEPSAIPLAPGITPGFVEDLYVLAYDDPQSVRFIDQHAGEIAGVLIEPVRSRRPDCQPLDFLHELREVTARSSIALIFDEVISGFRVAQGGAQEWFGVRADIATYGKVVGGGMPIGVVAGKASFLDAIDGGFWSFGDESYPAAVTTFFAGTFCKHPLTMAAANASLLYMKAQGPALQTTLNDRTSELAQRLNRLFLHHESAFEVVHFGSLFRFRSNGNCDPLYYHLLDRGVYIWEGRNCFLSTAHTQADLDSVVDAVDDTLREMGKSRVGAPAATPGSGLLPGPKQQDGGNIEVPLETAQRAAWASVQADSNIAGAFTLALAAELSGPLDLDRFRTAVSRAMLRYDALRLSVAADGEHAILGAPPELLVQSTEDWPRAELDQRLKAWVHENATRVFDLSRTPTSAISILRAGPARHLLILACHHIFCDGASLGMVLEGILQRYNAANVAAWEERELPQSFTQFLTTQANARDQQNYVVDQQFWRKEVGQPSSQVNIIGAAQRPRRKSFGAERLRRELDKNLLLDVLRLSRAHGCTPFVTLFTAWETAISTLSGCYGFRIACPVSRRSEALEKLIGYFQNLLPIRGTRTPQIAIADHLQLTRDAVLNALSHREYPFSDINRLVKGVREESRFPVADIGFNYEKFPLNFSLGDLEVTIGLSPISSALLDLTLNVSDAGDRFIADLDFNKDIYSPPLAEACIDAFETTLRQMRDELLGGSLRYVSRSPIPAPAFLGPDDMQLVSIAVEQQARRIPEQVACRFGLEQLSYGELNREANKLARYQQAAGVGPEIVVGICLERGLAMIQSLLATLKAGGAYLPLDPDYPVERLQSMVRDADLHVIVTRRRLAHLFAGTRAQLICIEDKAAWDQLEATDQLPRVAPSNLAYVIYTSGSTGKPKGVMLTHAGLANLIHEQIRLFDLGPGTAVLQVASPSFDASVSEIWTTLASGGQLQLASAEELSPGKPLETLLRDRQIEVVTLTPTALSLLSPVELLPKLRTLVTAGEACSASLAERWRNGRRLINAYGPTEATVCATAGTVDTPGTPTLGLPLGHVQVHVLDKFLDPVPAGAAGELYLGGQGIARGYLRRPALTAERFLPDPTLAGQRLYRTGDLVRLDSHGQIHFLGRTDSQIKFHGIRVEPAEIETALLCIPGITGALVLLRTDLGQDPRLVAYLTTDPNAPALSVDQLRTEIESLLPAHMLPNSFIFLTAFPTTPNGKLDRAALPTPLLQRPHLSQTYVPPSSPTELSLARLWSDVLQIETVGIHDNFFELGGDSIQALQIASRAAHHGIKVTPKQLFAQKTIAKLLDVGQSHESEKGGETRHEVAARIASPHSLTPIQHWFFDQRFEEIDRWNMALLLRTETGMKILEDAVCGLLQHYPVLQSAFVQADGGWAQVPAPSVSSSVFLSIDLRGLEESVLFERIDNMLDTLNGEFSLVSGFVFRVVFFSHETSPLVLLIAHHLVMDAVSWQILIQDLGHLCRCREQDKPLKLPRDSVPISLELVSFVLCRLILNADEPILWLKQTELSGGRNLPMDNPSASNFEFDAETIHFELSPEASRKIVIDLAGNLKVDAASILIAAFGAAWLAWTSSPVLTLAIEAHGRTLPGSHDLDLTRSIGWFTGLFPACLEIPPSQPGGELRAIRAIHSQVHEVAAHGIDYGIQKYLGRSHAEAASAINDRPPDICFNYLGSFDTGISASDSPFRLLATPTRGTRSPYSRRPHVLEVEAMASNAALIFSIGYSRAQFHRETIEALLLRVKSFLLENINEQQGHTETALVSPGVSKIPAATWSCKACGPACGRDPSNRAVDCMLTPLQRSMLTDLLFTKQQGAYIQQLSCQFSSGLDVVRFVSIWQKVVDQADALRLHISRQRNETRGAIESNPVELPYELHDWQSQTKSDQEALWSSLLRDDRAKGFDLSKAPLMRLQFVRMGPQVYRMLWTFHHLVLDGWSVSLLLEKVCRGYEHRLEGGSLFAFLPSQREFAAWLGERSSSAAEIFWRTYFQGHQWSAAYLPSAPNAGPSSNVPAMGEHRICLSDVLCRRLKDLSQRSNTTLNTLMQGAWALTLGALSKKEDVVFGNVVSGRFGDFPKIQELIGMCANTMMIRITMRDQSIATWLAELQAAHMTVQEYGQSPLSKVRIWSGAPPRKRLFDSTFVFENYPGKRQLESLFSLAVDELTVHEQTDLPFSVVVEPGPELCLRLVYDSHQFSEQDTSLISTVFQSSLENMVTDPTTSVLRCMQTMYLIPYELEGA